MANTQFKVDNGLLVTGGDSLFQANVVVNANARVANNLTVNGDLVVSGNLAFSNVSVSGQMVPTSNGVLLGNTTRTFTVSADSLYISNSIINSNGTNINIAAGSGIVANTVGISVNATSISNGVLNIGQGGTNATSQNAALNNLLPTQNAAVSGYALKTTGTSAFWGDTQGFTGSRGDTGFQGPTGFTGSRGPVGFTGSQGATGATGAPGSNGADGARGFTGSQGPVGFTGSQGATGATGPQGPAGTFSGSYTGNMSINGSITATGDITAFFSDDRLKTRIGNIDSALDKLMSLNGFLFEPNELAQSLGYEKKKEVGVSAQEVENVLPQAVSQAPIDSKYLAVKYERLIPLIIEAIKELKLELDKVKGE